jgi:predicted aspartyl protease
MKHEFLIEKRKIIVVAQIKGINDAMNFNFILDTGSSKTIIDEQVTTRLGFNLKRLKTGDRFHRVF